jgi:hypothetical protein
MKSFDEFPVKTGKPVSSRDKDREQEWEFIRDDKKLQRDKGKIRNRKLFRI